MVCPELNGLWTWSVVRKYKGVGNVSGTEFASSYEGREIPSHLDSSERANYIEFDSGREVLIWIPQKELTTASLILEGRYSFGSLRKS
jgi:hypothetical protein